MECFDCGSEISCSNDKIADKNLKHISNTNRSSLSNQFSRVDGAQSATLSHEALPRSTPAKEIHLDKSEGQLKYSDASRSVEFLKCVENIARQQPSPTICLDCVHAIDMHNKANMSRLRDRKRGINTILSGFRSDACKEFSYGLNETNATKEAVCNMEQALGIVRGEKESIEEQLERSKIECNQAFSAEDCIWGELNLALCKYNEFSNKRGVRMHISRQTQRNNSLMKQRSSCSELFSIWYDGPFGTINGFRMGRLPKIQTNWHEVNAALGEAALLLYTVAISVSYTFSSVTIIPLGSVSTLRKVHGGLDPQVLNLFGDDGVNNSGSNFNLALCAFLQCILELSQWTELQDETIRFPYMIDGNRIGELPIVLLDNEVVWTKALKYCLTNLKWILAWWGKSRRK